MRSTKLPLGAYSTETSAVVGAWVLLERNDKDQTGDAVGEGGQNSQLGDSEADGAKPAVSSGGRALTPNVRNVRQCRLSGCFAYTAVAVQQCYNCYSYENSSKVRSPLKVVNMNFDTCSP